MTICIIFPKKKQWQLSIQGDSLALPTRFDAIHLACGDLPVLDPYQLEGSPAYLADPYPLKTLETEVFDGQTVAVVGTGLAAVDVIKWLLSHTEAVVQTFSRSNYFPTVRILEGPTIDWQFFYR